MPHNIIYRSHLNVIELLEPEQKPSLLLVVAPLVGHNHPAEAQQAQGGFQRGEALGGVQDVPCQNQVEAEGGPGLREGLAPTVREAAHAVQVSDVLQ